MRTGVLRGMLWGLVLVGMSGSGGVALEIMRDAMEERGISGVAGLMGEAVAIRGDVAGSSTCL